MADFKAAARQIAIQQSRRQNQLESLESFEASNYVAKGRFLMDGSGEVTRDIKFPVTFIEEPSFFCGGIMEDNQVMEIGFAPTISGVVISFVKEKRGIDTVLYKGARLAVVTTGLADLKMWVSWHFMGDALVNPIGTALGIGAV